MDIKTLFISDVHLGSRHASTGDLLDFLERVKNESPPEKLYIVGDFIDGWKLKKNWYWNDNATMVIRKILSLLRRGTEVYLVAGNHDEFLRTFIEDFNILEFGSIKLGNEFVHELADGRKVLVVHGDVFDLATQYAKWLCHAGDIGYSIMLNANSAVNWCRRKLGLSRWSLSKAVKANVKNAINYIGNFESSLTAYGRDKGCDGCVCGHIHTADLRDRDGFVYANTGDWVESCTAIYEDSDGKLHLYKHHES